MLLLEDFELLVAIVVSVVQELELVLEVGLIIVVAVVLVLEFAVEDH